MAKKRPASTIGRDAWSQFEAAFVPEDLPPWERAMCRFSFFHGIETAIKFAQVLNGQKYEADRARVWIPPVPATLFGAADRQEEEDE